MPTVTPDFEQAAHRYFVDGVEHASVTTILKNLGLYPPYSDDPFYRDRGTAVHTATEFSDLNVLDKTLTHPDILPYVECWELFVSDMGLTFEREHIEVRVADTPTGTAGTIDRIMVWRGEWWIWDIKSGDPPPVTALQLAGYADVSGHNGARRASVWLRPGMNPRYRIREYTDRNDLAVWRACRAIHASPAAMRLWAAMAEDVRYDDLINCQLLFGFKKGMKE
jgi:hypothetical protein